MANEFIKNDELNSRTANLNEFIKMFLSMYLIGKNESQNDIEEIRTLDIWYIIYSIFNKYQNNTVEFQETIIKQETQNKFAVDKDNWLVQK